VRFDSLVEGTRRLLRNPLIGIGFAVVAIAFVATRWSDSWTELKGLAAGAHWLGLAAALVLYVLALLAIAAGIAISLGPSAGVFWGALGGQLLKYIPGAVWQGIPTAAERSTSGYLTYGAVTLGAASVGLLLSRRPLIVAAGFAFCAILLFAGFRSASPATTVTVALLVVVAVVCLAASAAAVGSMYGLDPATWGRDLAAAWGVGVLSIPVPAGLGIRELALTGFSEADTATIALVATSHRSVTLVGDVAAGVVGLIAHARVRRS